MCELSTETQNTRKQLFGIATARGGHNSCTFYSYLSIETLWNRHRVAAKYLDMINPSRILDIEAYTNPIHSSMQSCPDFIVVVDPCEELAHSGTTPYLSKKVICTSNISNRGVERKISKHDVLPTSIKSFINTPHMQHFNAIVCMGCDKNYGPSWDELMISQRPFHLVLEF